MKKWIAGFIMLFAAATVLTACGGSENNAANSGADATGEVKEFTIDATNFDFDLKEIKVNKGDTVKITLKNSEGTHAVKFDKYNQEVKGNETITFVADKAGEFEYICSIFCGAGHDDMVGKLIVQ